MLFRSIFVKITISGNPFRMHLKRFHTTLLLKWRAPLEEPSLAKYIDALKTQGVVQCTDVMRLVDLQIMHSSQCNYDTVTRRDSYLHSSLLSFVFIGGHLLMSVFITR